MASFIFYFDYFKVDYQNKSIDIDILCIRSMRCSHRDVNMESHICGTVPCHYRTSFHEEVRCYRATFRRWHLHW